MGLVDWLIWAAIWAAVDEISSSDDSMIDWAIEWFIWQSVWEAVWESTDSVLLWLAATLISSEVVDEIFDSNNMSD